MRVAALAFGILAGLVASLILALGGLDVAADLGAATDDRQAQAIRFGLFVIGNLGFFGAALVLAAPLAGAIFLILGGVAWVGAALLMHHTTDLVLIVPPALLLVAAIFGVIAHFRRPLPAEDEEPDVEIIAPVRGERRAPPSETMEDADEEVGIPAFAAAEAKAEPSTRSAFDNDRLRPQDGDWNPRRRQPPPPRAKPAFRPVEDEYEDDEPSGFSRFALGISGILSFGLYAALAGAAVLIVWNLRTEQEQPAVTVAELPTASSTLELDVSTGSEEPRLSSEEQTLEPILTGEPIREIETSATAPSASPSELGGETPAPEPGTFGTISMPDGQVTVPALADDFFSDEEAAPLPVVSATPPALPPAESSEPLVADAAPLDLQSPQPEPTVPAAGQPFPVAVPPAIAAQRLAPGTGPTTVVVSRPANSNNTGL